MRVIPGNAQSIGDRASQEDAFGFSDFSDQAFARHGGVLMVLCDGMGGLANGADASGAAVEAVLAGYQRKTPGESIPDALNRAILEAHAAVCAVAGSGNDAGTTVVAAVVWRDRLYWGALGDSRLYLCRGDRPARQLTEDNNVATLIAARIRRGESVGHRAVGAREGGALTAYLGAPVPPPLYAGRDGMMLRPGDRIVACSDGLYRGLSPEAIVAISTAADPMTAAEQMIEAVLRCRLPHQDNLTVAMLALVPERQRVLVPDRDALAKLGPLVGSFAAGALFSAALFWAVLPRSPSPERVQPMPADAEAATGAASAARDPPVQDRGDPEQQPAAAHADDFAGSHAGSGSEAPKSGKTPPAKAKNAAQAGAGLGGKDVGSTPPKKPEPMPVPPIPPSSAPPPPAPSALVPPSPVPTSPSAPAAPPVPEPLGGGGVGDDTEF